ncbi:YafY family protein [Bacteriovorax sp. Seq25_V]|uniref:helix-turn-helix transcriptional regulator n=1 Tax=Bacteriovorax sp. Seq25_V TaxID=1201288 RepID=UPI000389E2F4|nr:WYL domain-containing protein [Bacteriovorax sp. Seq25_V]EQC47256.1 HTH domain protein [Bacteriovorax sp. Seq25_V]
MGKGSLRDKSQRHSLILSLLKSEDYWTTELLCQKLSISHRTIMRDLAELREIGHPIDSDKGRGGGISLRGRWGLTKLLLNNEEVISMLVSLAVTEAIGTPILGGNLKSIRNRISDSFPLDQKNLIRKLRGRIYVGKLASSEVLNSYMAPKDSILGDLNIAFFHEKVLVMKYKDGQDKISEREVEPQIILLNWPVWYFLCWDRTKNDKRLFRVDRILKIKLTNQNFALRNPGNLTKGLEEYFEQL